ncbi:hypothetical protein MMSR116_08190 [Methylobacterium mesophilicum SR1.6/6]|uniref:Uncharacterized protein n=1 Tax=Methylobacterium mesophilicum SR1.6/6 TaxID=908290 RepID=A0A6B9FGE4_9HYPH|nr:hypothetical protein [Methylobacterium mesophilicum]QGY01861.1 hypothetical protein MMSR116_08190 [Methylobacterium mesophilicum SR1.6/6]
MPNYAFNRLTLTGPADEVARFVRECVRIREDQPNDPPSLDLNAIVPMPSEILESRHTPAVVMPETGSAVASLPDWLVWRSFNWGTKWNTCAFYGGMISDTIYDCQFDTAWACPEPALSALAARYPRLRGTVVAHDESSDWSVIAVFRDGRYLTATGGFDPRFAYFAYAGHNLDRVGVLSAKALIYITDDPELFRSPRSSGLSTASTDTLDPLWTRRELAIEEFGRLVGGNLQRRLQFERIVFDLHNHIDDRHRTKMAEVAEYSHHFAADIRFLINHQHTQTPIDIKLMTILSTIIRKACMYGHDDKLDEDHLLLIEEEIFDAFTRDDLNGWAAVTTCRLGVTIDRRRDDTLRESFLSHTERLHNDIIDHLRDEHVSDY